MACMDTFKSLPVPDPAGGGLVVAAGTDETLAATRQIHSNSLAFAVGCGLGSSCQSGPPRRSPTARSPAPAAGHRGST